MEALEWALGILTTINMALLGFIGSRLWTHVVECKSVATDVAFMKADVERMKQDIGTHDTGMRGNVHKVSNLCMEHEMRIATLERQ